MGYTPYIYGPNPGFANPFGLPGASLVGGGFAGMAAPVQAPAPPAPHLQFNFDTIGQTIPIALGNVRVAGQIIWAQGIEESGDESTSPTQTFALALFAPLDSEEEGEIFSIWDGDTLVHNDGNTIAPVGWSDADAAALSASLAGIQMFPGDEAQQPATTIVADKGSNRTNAFRGIRYVIVPNYPVAGGSSGGGGRLPNFSFNFRRKKDGEDPEEESEAAEFLSGST